MIFNKDQINIKDFYLPDMDFGNLNEDQMLEIFNALPSKIQGLAVTWGFNDTGFRDQVFTWILENQFGLTPKEYYSKGMFENQYVFNFSKLK